VVRARERSELIELEFGVCLSGWKDRKRGMACVVKAEKKIENDGLIKNILLNHVLHVLEERPRTRK